MTKYFPVVVEKESNGTFSAWVPGLPGVYAAADSAREAKQAIRGALDAHLTTLEKRGQSIDKITARKNLTYANLGSTILGRSTSPAKARAARLNGRKGGRPALAR
jgi:predicted RNase H-like HicB family nuclease